MDALWDPLSYSRQDLSTCAEEPIQFCGAIQDWGFFLVCSPSDGTILAASANLTKITGKPTESLFGEKLSSFLESTENSNKNFADSLIDYRGQNLILRSRRDKSILLAQVGQSEDYITVDLEFAAHAPEQDPTQFVEQLRKLVFEIDAELDTPGMLARAAKQIRDLTHFDRVMVYRFELNHDGCVIAESPREGLNPFQGLWYPASDIPEQARVLYLNSKFRMIVDSQAKAIPILTKSGLGRSEIDLSQSALRAVSPFHAQYLQNMGVRASFSIPLKVEGRLWGLIACHQYSGPLHLSRELRSSCELAGQVLSGRLADQMNERRLRTRNQILTISQSLLGRVAEGETPIGAFREVGRDLLEMTASSGVIVHFGGETAIFGVTPNAEWVADLVEKLKPLNSLTAWASDCVARDLKLKPHRDGVGALAVPLSFAFEDYICWFRPEHVREVQWGGDPKAKGDARDHLTPRTSFQVWTESVRDRSREWNESAQEAAQQLLFVFVRGIFQKAAELSRANGELEKLTRAKDEFIGMISHELRTPLGVMIGWIDILRDEGSFDPRVNQALEIIERNAKLQVNLINDLLDVSRIIAGKMRLNPQDRISIGEVIRDVVKDFGHGASAKRVNLKAIVSEEIIAPVDPDRMRQIIWNLISNAIKFTPKGGSIEVKLERVDSTYQIRVRDDGIGIEPDQLKRIFDRFAQSTENHASLGGLGLGLSIVKALVELHGGQIFALSDGEGTGATFVASFPMFNLMPADDKSLDEKPFGRATSELDGVRILVAEDQTDAGLALDYYLKRAGATTTLVRDGGAAFEKLSREEFDILLSDVGMPVMDGVELVKRIRKLENERKTPMMPAVALTAYATAKDRVRCLQAGFQSHLTKPVDREELIAVIRAALSPPR